MYISDTLFSGHWYLSSLIRFSNYILPHISICNCSQQLWEFFFYWLNYISFPLEKEMATHSSILGWKIPWTEEPGGPCGGKRVGHDWAHARTYYYYMRIDNTLGCKAYLGTRDLLGFNNSYSTEGGVSDSCWSQNHEQWPGSCFPSFPRAPLSDCSFDPQGNSAKEFKTNSSSQN